MVPRLLPIVPPSHCTSSCTAGTPKGNTVPLNSLPQAQRSWLPGKLHTSFGGTQQEKGLGRGPCGHSLADYSAAMRTQLWAGRTQGGWGYVTFMGTARAEGERSTTWCPAIGLNFNRTKRGRGRGRRGRGSWKWNGRGGKGWNKRQAKGQKA